MAKFKVGDSVRVVKHPNKEYVGLEGTIAAMPEAPGSGGEANTQTDKVSFVNEITYDIQVKRPPLDQTKCPDRLWRVPEECLELISKAQER